MYRKFKLSTLRDRQQRAGLGSGSIGLHPGKKSDGKRSAVIPNAEIHKPSRAYKKGKSQKSLTNKDTFENVRFKFNRPDMAGQSRGKIGPGRTEYLGEQSLDYDPFVQTLGHVEEGAQSGGGDYDARKPTNVDYSVKPKFSIVNSGKRGLGHIKHADPYPSTGGEMPTQYKNLVRLK